MKSMKKSFFYLALLGLMLNGTVNARNTKKRNLEFYQKKAMEDTVVPDVSGTLAKLACVGSVGFAIGKMARAYMARAYSVPPLCTLEVNKHLLRGVVCSAGALTLYGLYKEYHAGHPSTKAWYEQLQKLNNKEFLDDPVIIGQKTYLVSSVFGNTDFVHAGNRYEIYVMYRKENVADVYHKIIKALDSKKMHKHIDFVALNISRDIQYDAHGKPLPRIIIRLAKDTSKKNANAVLNTIYNATNSFIGPNVHPRYSRAVTPVKTNMIYTAFGSGDYKEVHKNQFERKTGLLWNAPDDMAYRKYETEALSIYDDQQEQEK
jgi:hypothetical protein